MAFSMSSCQPLFPSLVPRLVDPLWHKVDVAKNEDAELEKLEKEQENLIKNVKEKDYHLTPIGKTSQETLDDEDDEEEDDNNSSNNETSDSDEAMQDDNEGSLITVHVMV